MFWSAARAKPDATSGGPLRRIGIASSGRIGRMSLASRLALVNALIALVTIAIAGCVSYVALARQIDRHADSELKAKAHSLAQMLSDLSGATSAQAWQQSVRAALTGHEDLHLALIDGRSGEALFTSSSLATESLRRIDWRVKGLQEAVWRFNSADQIASFAVAMRMAKRDNVTAVLSQDRSREAHFLARYARVVVPALLALGALLLVCSWWIARLELAPLDRFSQTAARIGSRSLGQRLDLSDLPQELAGLADEFNAMLARIEQGMQRVSHFAADLAHELRTPIGILFGRTQVALSRGRSEGELRQVLEDNVLELERLSRLISDMLFIAQDAEVDACERMSTVKLGDSAERVVEFMSLAAEERGAILRVSGDAVVVANEVLIQRALTNLISNAIKHADAGSAVDVRIGHNNEIVSLEVINQGEPIPSIHLERIFERFYRVDASRARHEGGTGLGLAIVDAIAKRHGGRVWAESGPGRETRFRLDIPAPCSASERSTGP